MTVSLRKRRAEGCSRSQQRRTAHETALQALCGPHSAGKRLLARWHLTAAMVPPERQPF